MTTATPPVETKGPERPCPDDPSCQAHPVWSRERIDGIFDLADRTRVAVVLGHVNHHWIVGSAHVADDFLTAITLYTFGHESFKRLVFSRPSAEGMTLLRHRKQQVIALVREYPPRHQVLEFGVAPEAEATWARLVGDRQAMKGSRP